MGTAGSENGAIEPIKVFLLDDHEIVRRGVRDMLEAEGDIKVIGEAGTACRRSPGFWLCDLTRCSPRSSPTLTT